MCFLLLAKSFLSPARKWAHGPVRDISGSWLTFQDFLNVRRLGEKEALGFMEDHGRSWKINSDVQRTFRISKRRFSYDILRHSCRRYSNLGRQDGCLQLYGVRLWEVGRLSEYLISSFPWHTITHTYIYIYIIYIYTYIYIYHIYTYIYIWIIWHLPKPASCWAWVFHLPIHSPHTFPYTSPTFPAFPDLPKIPMPKGTSARNSIVHSEIVCQHVSIRHLWRYFFVLRCRGPLPTLNIDSGQVRDSTCEVSRCLKCRRAPLTVTFGVTSFAAGVFCQRQTRQLRRLNSYDQLRSATILRLAFYAFVLFQLFRSGSFRRFFQKFFQKILSEDSFSLLIISISRVSPCFSLQRDAESTPQICIAQARTKPRVARP